MIKLILLIKLIWNNLLFFIHFDSNIFVSPSKIFCNIMSVRKNNIISILYSLIGDEDCFFVNELVIDVM